MSNKQRLKVRQDLLCLLSKGQRITYFPNIHQNILNNPFTVTSPIHILSMDSIHFPGNFSFSYSEFPTLKHAPNLPKAFSPPQSSPLHVLHPHITPHHPFPAKITGISTRTHEAKTTKESRTRPFLHYLTIPCCTRREDTEKPQRYSCFLPLTAFLMRKSHEELGWIQFLISESDF